MLASHTAVYDCITNGILVGYLKNNGSEGGNIV